MPLSNDPCIVSSTSEKSNLMSYGEYPQSMPEDTSSELLNDVPGFGTHFAKHFSEVFWATICNVQSECIATMHTVMSSCAVARLISARMVFTTASFCAAMSNVDHSAFPELEEKAKVPGLLLDDDLKKSDMIWIFDCHRSVNSDGFKGVMSKARVRKRHHTAELLVSLLVTSRKRAVHHHQVLHWT